MKSREAIKAPSGWLTSAGGGNAQGNIHAARGRSSRLDNSEFSPLLLIGSLNPEMAKHVAWLSADKREISTELASFLRM